VNLGKSGFAIGGKISIKVTHEKSASNDSFFPIKPVDFPRFPPIVRLFYVHGRRSERLESDDQVGDVKFGLQIQLDRHVLYSIFGLRVEIFHYFIFTFCNTIVRTTVQILKHSLK